MYKLKLSMCTYTKTRIVLLTLGELYRLQYVLLLYIRMYVYVQQATINYAVN